MSDFPRWCLFFDFHTMPANPDVGKCFDIEAIVDRFVAAGVQYVVFPARANLGNAYYNTNIGTRHPALTYDLLPKLVEECHRHGIKFTAYINAGISQDEGLKHRDWLVMQKDGRIYEIVDGGAVGRQMCYNTAYGDHLVEMVKETITHCNVDGMFLDCFYAYPCYGHECIEAMRQEGVDINDDDQVADFNLRKQHKMAMRISEAARSVKPDVMLYFNGIGYEAQAEMGSYLELECLPTGGWGYDFLPFCARYLRTLGKPVLNMTARFHQSWGDFGGIRTDASLEYDCIYGIANGLYTTIGDHFHPRGDINRAVADMDTRIYQRLQKLDPWINDAKPVTEIALATVYPYPGHDMLSPNRQPIFMQSYDAVRGGTRMLCELKQQFDVPSYHSSWDKYDLIVLPDFVPATPELKKRIRAHLDKGGKIIASAWSGLDKEANKFAFGEWGVEYIRDDEFDPAFFNASRAIASEFPDMPMNLYAKGVEISAANGTEVLGTICAPYYNRHWDGEHGYVYLPPDRDTGRPAITCNGQVGYVSHAIFKSYFDSASLPGRQILKVLLDRLLPRPLLKTPCAPSFARATVTEQPSLRMVYFLAYMPECRGNGVNMIEEPLIVENQKIQLRMDGMKYSRAYLAPDRTPLEMTIEDGYACVTLPRIQGYAVVVFEE